MKSYLRGIAATCLLGVMCLRVEANGPSQPAYPLYATTGAGNILVFAGPESYTEFASGLNNPGGIAIDPKGNVFVVEAGANRVLKYSAPNTFSVYGYVTSPASLALDACGNLFVSSVLDGTVTMFTGPMQSRIYAANLHHPVGVALDQEQQVHVSQFGDETNGSVVKLRDDGSATNVATGLASVRAISFAPDGALVLTQDDATGSVSKYPVPGAGVQIVTDLYYPFGAFAGPDGTIFVAQPSSITRYSADGNSNEAVTSGAFYPNHVAWQSAVKRHNFCARRR